MSKKGKVKRRREKEGPLKRGLTRLFLFRPFHEEAGDIFFPFRVTVVKTMGDPDCRSPDQKTYA